MFTHLHGLFLLIIPSLVQSQCFSTVSNSWVCHGRGRSNNLTYQMILTDPSVIQLTLSDYHWNTFTLDDYSLSLRTLNVSSNRFQTVRITSKQRITSNLRHLTLQSNKIERFHHDTVVLPNSLERISLADNHLRMLDARLFSYLPHLREIDLRNNFLKRIAPVLLTGRSIFLNNNPLDCRCTPEAYRMLCERATNLKPNTVCDASFIRVSSIIFDLDGRQQLCRSSLQSSCQ
jgi:hypothetical protein